MATALETLTFDVLFMPGFKQTLKWFHFQTEAKDQSFSKTASI